MQTLEDVLAELNCDGSKDDGFICRSCFRLLERYKKIKDEVFSIVVKTLPMLTATSPAMPSCSSSCPQVSTGSGDEQIQRSQAGSPSVLVSLVDLLHIKYI